MVRTLTPQQEAQHIGSEQPVEVRVERVEYGKLCVEPDGRILGTVEHRQLGWSELVPEDIIPFCLPSRIGVSSSDFEELPGGCLHGTVLRPVLFSSRQTDSRERPYLNHRKVIPVMCRVKARPEDGKDGTGRLYTMARYIFTNSDEMEPQGLLAALAPKSNPMQGLTPDDIARPLPGFRTTRFSPPELDDLTVLFLRQALVYVLSGIPISIADFVKEEVFFKWVAALWWLLPSTLRPHLSAGWGVGSSLSGKLAVTYASHRAETCAAFYPADRSWKKPRQVEYLEKDKIIREKFSAGRVHPGLYYVSFLFGCPPGQLPDINDMSTALKAEALINPPLKDNYPSTPIAPDFNDPDTNGVFRYPGWNAYNIYQLRELKRYLDGKDLENPSGFSTNLSTLTRTEKKREAFKMASEMMSDIQKRVPVDKVVWDMLKWHGRALFSPQISRARWSGSARLRLLAALQGDNPLSLLKALRRAARSEEADDLLEEITPDLHKLLDSSLTENNGRVRARCANLHEWLLQEKRVPDIYSAWAVKNNFDLGLTLFEKIDDGKLDAGGKLQDLIAHSSYASQPHALYTLRRWAEGEWLTPADKANIENINESSKRAFGNMLNKTWEQTENDKIEGERLLAWIKLAPPDSIDDPLLRIWFDLPITPDEMIAVAGKVELDIVPVSLLPGISKEALLKYEYLADRLTERADLWTEVIKFWPEEALFALWPPNNPPIRANNRRQVSENADKIKAAVKQMRISTDQLERLITAWLSSTREIRTRVSELHWQWLRQARQVPPPPDAPPSITPIVNMCRYFSGFEIRSENELAEAEVKKAIKFAESAGVMTSLIQQSGAMWQNERNGLHLRFLLQFFPEQEFRTRASQLGALIEHREWLEGHLKKYPTMKSWLEIATRKELSITYSRSCDGRIVWKSEYSASPIWAIFWRVPFGKQGSLKDAIKAHCGSDIERQAAMCRRYWNGHEKDEYPQAIDRVVRDFIVPHLRGSYDLSEIAYFLSKGVSEEQAKGSKFWELVRLLSQDENTKKVLKNLPY